MLYRKITSYIEDYLKSDIDKILILEGARQIDSQGVRHFVSILAPLLFGSGAFC